MTKDEAMKLALEALETLDVGDSYKTHNAASALRQALEQPEVWTQKHWTEYERSIAAAENEACVFIASKEAQQWEYPSHANAAAVSIADAIRARMKND